jgi:formate/nitrite transporter FocA (FNT family)
MFLIPSGMMFGANITIADWWLWNGFPVITGNIAGGMFFTGPILFWTFKKIETDSDVTTR